MPSSRVPREIVTLSTRVLRACQVQQQYDRRSHSPPPLPLPLGEGEEDRRADSSSPGTRSPPLSPPKGEGEEQLGLYQDTPSPAPPSREGSTVFPWMSGGSFT